MSGESREVQRLLAQLAALDREIGERRASLQVDDLSDSARESARVALGMAGFAREKTLAELRRTGWRPGAPKQGDLL